MQLFANNAFTTLAAALTAGATSLSVQPGHGARFPTPVGGDFFLITLFQLVDGLEANHEIVKVTARAVDTLTIVRAQEGTAARAWGVGDQVSHRGTAGSLAGLAQLGAPANFAQAVSFPTAAAGTNTTQGATTAFVTAAVAQGKADLVASSPAALDTLNELATALGNDANFAATTAASLGNRLRIDVNNQALTAAQKLNGLTNLGIPNVENTSDANKPVSTATANALALKAPIDSAALTGRLSITNDEAYILRLRRTVSSGSFYIGTTPGAGNQALLFSTDDGTERMRVTAAGNVMLGTTVTNGWASWYRALDVTGYASFYGATTNNTGVTNNAYFDGTDWRYRNAAAASKYEQSGGVHTWSCAPSGAIGDIAVFAKSMTLASTGNVLIGTTSDDGVAKLQVAGSARFAGATFSTVNRTSTFYTIIENTGTSGNTANAGTIFNTYDGTSIATQGYIFATGKSWTYAGHGANSMNLIGAGAGGTNVTATHASGVVKFFTAGEGVANERMRIDATGNLQVGVVGSNFHRIAKDIPLNVGGPVIEISGWGVPGLAVYATTGAYGNVANVAVRVGSDNNTGKSINAGGTINTGGNDYAEYMTKTDNCGDLAKGAVVGVTATGKLTDKWDDAVSFLVKSTSPSFVGGDAWGNEEALGMSRPVEPQRKFDVTEQRLVSEAVPATDDEEAVDAVYETIVLEAGDTDTEWQVKQDEHAAAVVAFETALEAARQKVDRIAFAGQVPVNVYGATPGQFIVPGCFGGEIGGVAMDASKVTHELYIRAVGIVQNILPDGRANVRVKVA